MAEIKPILPMTAARWADIFAGCVLCNEPLPPGWGSAIFNALKRGEQLLRTLTHGSQLRATEQFWAHNTRGKWWISRANCKSLPPEAMTGSIPTEYDDVFDAIALAERLEAEGADDGT